MILFLFPTENELKIQLKYGYVFLKANEFRNRLKYGWRTKIPTKNIFNFLIFIIVEITVLCIEVKRKFMGFHIVLFCLTANWDVQQREFFIISNLRHRSFPMKILDTVLDFRGTLYKVLNGVFRVKTFYKKVVLKYQINPFFKFVIIKT